MIKTALICYLSLLSLTLCEVDAQRGQSAHIHQDDPCPHLNVSSEFVRKLISTPGSDNNCCGCPSDHFLEYYCRDDDCTSTRCLPCPEGTFIDLEVHGQLKCFVSEKVIPSTPTNIVANSLTVTETPLASTTAPPSSTLTSSDTVKMEVALSTEEATKRNLSLPIKFPSVVGTDKTNVSTSETKQNNTKKQETRNNKDGTSFLIVVGVLCVLGLVAAAAAVVLLIKYWLRNKGGKENPGEHENPRPGDSATSSPCESEILYTSETCSCVSVLLYKCRKSPQTQNDTPTNPSALNNRQDVDEEENKSLLSERVDTDKPEELGVESTLHSTTVGDAATEKTSAEPFDDDTSRYAGRLTAQADVHNQHPGPSRHIPVANQGPYEEPQHRQSVQTTGDQQEERKLNAIETFITSELASTNVDLKINGVILGFMTFFGLKPTQRQQCEDGNPATHLAKALQAIRQINPNVTADEVIDYFDHEGRNRLLSQHLRDAVYGTDPHQT